MLCQYYTANVEINKTWYFVATFRAQEHVAFDRTLDKLTGLFEFFVPIGQEEEFLKIMGYYLEHKIVKNLEKKENRLQDPAARL